MTEPFTASRRMEGSTLSCGPGLVTDTAAPVSRRFHSWVALSKNRGLMSTSSCCRAKRGALLEGTMSSGTISFWLHFVSEIFGSLSNEGDFVCPANPPYNVSSNLLFVFSSDTVSLPMAQAEEVLGATTLTHWQTRGSEQYGAPRPFFQCCAQAHDALFGRSGCFGPFW